jgi:hypothetical protein
VPEHTVNHLSMMNLQNEKLDTTWLESLAIEEINMEESGFIRFADSADPMRILEEESIQFINKVKDRFEFYVSLFNQYRVNRDQGRMIKVFRISNTINDFMLFRNSLKLIVARKAPDLISVGFLSNSGGLFSPRIPGDNSPQTSIHEIKAVVGPFNHISWRYHGQEIDIDTMVRFYLTEFIRNSAR